MPFGSQKAEVKKCARTFPPHPCDPPEPCDPNFLQDQCPEPFLCTEMIKNPAVPGEITTCKPGPSIYARTCHPAPPPHLCDSKAPCSKKPANESKRPQPCSGRSLCIERIKNPENREKEDPSCDSTK